jgi:hypothetical protein
MSVHFITNNNRCAAVSCLHGVCHVNADYLKCLGEKLTQSVIQSIHISHARRRSHRPPKGKVFPDDHCLFVTAKLASSMLLFGSFDVNPDTTSVNIQGTVGVLGQFFADKCRRGANVFSIASTSGLLPLFLCVDETFYQCRIDADKYTWLKLQTIDTASQLVAPIAILSSSKKDDCCVSLTMESLFATI